ncbi:hypothetical protein MKW92_027810 [Papaver armeniacum]|nr:hypothetical protein MKW92_027810 [Papaver armeniacum]
MLIPRGYIQMIIHRMTIHLLYLHSNRGQASSMEKRWFHSMLFNEELKHRSGLSKSMDSLGPFENTSGSEDPVIYDRDKNIDSGDDSDNSTANNMDTFFDVRDIRSLISDDIFLVRDRNGNSYSIYFNIENFLFEIDNDRSFMNELESSFYSYLNNGSQSDNHYYDRYMYDTQYSWNNHIFNCIDSYLRSEISIDNYISGDSYNYSDSYMYSYICNESVNSSDNESSSIRISTNRSDFNMRRRYNDLDINKKYKHLWVQCESCYGLNYKKFFKSKLNHCFFHLLNSESRHKKLSNFETNGWKNWLNSHYNYQYNFSKITSSQLALQKQRNGVNQSHTISNKASTKLDSYEQKNVFHYKKQNDYVMDSLSSKTKNFKKQYGYDLLSQKYINYREGKDSYISLLPLQVKGSRKIPYNYNTNKPPIFYMPAGIYMSHYLGEDCIKIDIEAWDNMDTETRMDKNTKTGINFYSIINQIDTKDLSYLAIDKQIKPSSGKKIFFDWMGMNEEILNRPISNLHLWFFPELLGLYDTYRIKPWIIPTKSLLFHFNGNQTTSENKKLKNRNQNKWKSTTEAELDFFLKRYFLFQLRWHSSLDQRIFNSIQIYYLLLRLNNPKQISISSIQRGEMRLDLLLIQKDLNLTELINKGVLIIEPVRLSIQGDGLFIMYQTIVISLVHKSNHQTNRKNQQNENDYKNSFDESIKRHRHERVLEKRDEKNYAFVVPENILAPRCRRELRIQICLNSEKKITFLEESKHLDKDPKNLDRDRNKLMKLKFFLWPNYRLEDLACMNRYWFDTSNGSRFGMSRIYMYPRFTIN